MSLATTDLCDKYGDEVQIAEPVFRDFGGRRAFAGPISTIKTFEDNALVRKTLEEAGEGRVLVVDGGGSLRCALFGDQLAALAVENGWNGVIVNGCIRDSAQIAEMDVGLKALTTHPLKSIKGDIGRAEVIVKFAGVTFTPRHMLYADADGIIVSPETLLL